MYEKFDNHSVNVMRQAIQVALEPLGVKFGMEFKVGNIKYNSQSLEANLTCAIGTLDEKERRDFERLCSKYGVPKDFYNVPFTYAGKEYRLYGFNTKAPKYPLKLRDVSGGGVKAPLSILTAALADFRSKQGIA